jgi:outer membrane protein assembly factor BamE (lipoprotein component of BamABCDE complex)
MRHRLVALMTFLVLAGSLAACAALTTGREFPSPKPGAEIKNGATTKAELLKMYGDPTQVGIKDGDQTWTWYYWKSEKGKDGSLSKQLDVTFNAQGVVKSYSFSSNFPEDMKTR